MLFMVVYMENVKSRKIQPEILTIVTSRKEESFNFHYVFPNYLVLMTNFGNNSFLISLLLMNGWSF